MSRYEAVRSSLTLEARAAADQAAQRAGVTVRELWELPDLREASDLLDRVWRPPAGSPLITPELLRVLEHSGSYVVGAYRDDVMVGACVGFLAATGLHSHIAGVDGRLRGGNVGYALKLHQRAWSLEHGITQVTWTYDPIIRRNAYFNLAKLGAVPEEYLPDFYGPMLDEVNAGSETDRIMVRWDLAEPRVVRACAGEPHVPEPGRAPTVALRADLDGRPVRGRLDGRMVLVGLPPDVEALRGTAPLVAREWRMAVRETLGGLMAGGGLVTGFGRDGWYVVDRGEGGRG